MPKLRKSHLERVADALEGIYAIMKKQYDADRTESEVFETKASAAPASIPVELNEGMRVRSKNLPDLQHQYRGINGVVYQIDHEREEVRVLTEQGEQILFRITDVEPQ